MKCARVQKQLIEFEDGALPPELQAHVTSCASCRSQYESSQAVRRLLSLKNHETPAPGVHERCLTAIHREIRVQDVHRLREASRSVWELLTLEPLPALRYGMAVLLIALVSVHVLTMPELASVEEELTEMPASAVPAVSPLLSGFSAARTEPLSVFSQARATNAPARSAGSGTGYGTVPSTLVNFEY